MTDGELAIDYGTSNTVALVRTADGRSRQLLFDSSPLLPSAVLAERDGMLCAGRDAVRAARIDPARFEPNPKRRIDEPDVLLGDRVYPLADLFAATLRTVAAEAGRVLGRRPGRVLLTHPAAWGQTRRAVLVDGCVRAGLPAPTLIPEPVAAATYFAGLPHVRLPVGQAVVVYDLGAGTFDVSVVRRGPNGFETLGDQGLDDVGGLDLDALVVDHAIGRLRQSHPPVWQRLTHPSGAEDRRHRRLLWDDAREAKEALSRQHTATFPLPLTGLDAMITRPEFESAARPLLMRTIDVTAAAIRQSGVPAEQIAGIFLVGGGSRIPLVATLLHQRQGTAPTALEQPEIVVAEGALATGGAQHPPDGRPGPGMPAGGVSAGGAPTGFSLPSTDAPVLGRPTSGPPSRQYPADPFGQPPADPFPPPADPFRPPPADPFGPPRADPFGPPPPPGPQEDSGLWPDDPSDRRPGSPANAPVSGPRTSGLARVPPSAQAPPGGRPAEPGRPAARTYRSSRRRRVFHWTDPLWLIAVAWWIWRPVTMPYQLDLPVPLILALAVAVAGYGLDVNTRRRTPWWLKIVVPGVLSLTVPFVMEKYQVPDSAAGLALAAAVAIAVVTFLIGNRPPANQP